MGPAVTGAGEESCEGPAHGLSRLPGSVGARVELSYIQRHGRRGNPAGLPLGAVCALPSNQVGEIVGGELFASPRPAGPHARVTSKLAGKLDGPFDGGVGGPGGWIILYEPELHLSDTVLAPDLVCVAA